MPTKHNTEPEIKNRVSENHAPDLRRVDLNPSQAQALAQIAHRKAAVEKEWAVALTLVGIEPDSVAGGNLDDDPHFMVREDDLSP